MPATMLCEHMQVADMTGPLPYWGPITTTRPLWRPRVTAGLTPLAAAREALRARLVQAA